MKRLPRHWRWWSMGIVMVAAVILASQFLRPLREARGFDVPTAREAERARAGFASVLGGGDGVPDGLERLRFSDRAGVTGLREAAGACQGRGAYLLRKVSMRPLALVAPHRGSDRHTGTLVDLLFAEQPIAAAAWNSAPRRAGESCAAGDPARHATHYLTAFSLAFAQTYPGGRIIQLHGFDTKKRESSAAQLADMIVSEGSDTPSGHLFDLADCLSATLAPRRVAVYPNEVAELGALTNQQGQALRNAGFGGFVHIEISAQLRADMVQDRALRDGFAACLLAGLE